MTFSLENMKYRYREMDEKFLKLPRYVYKHVYTYRIDNRFSYGRREDIY